MSYLFSTFNRTIMELKPEKQAEEAQKKAAFNRTIMELKLVFILSC